MNPLEKQTEILEKLSQILHEEAGYKYDNVCCEFESFGEGTEETAITTLYILRNGHLINSCMSDRNLFEAADLAVELRRAMKSHTGGEWGSFKLTLDKDGKAHTKFHYSEG